MNKFLAALTLLFIGLKLTNHIDWSWLWVLAPLWGPVAFFSLLTFLWFIFLLVEPAESRRKRELHDSIKQLQESLRKRS